MEGSATRGCLWRDCTILLDYERRETRIQSEILSILKETGGIELQVLLGKLKPKLTQKELEREFAALRRMEKARGEKRGDLVVWRLW